MSSKEELYITKDILSRISDLTSARDVEDFQYKLMATLDKLLNAKSLSIYRINEVESTCQILAYLKKNTESKLYHDRPSPNEIQFNCDHIPEDILLAKAYIEKHDAHYTFTDGNKNQLVYPIEGLNGVIGYLSLHIHQLPTVNEFLILNHLLNISNNFHCLLEESQIDKLTGLLNRKTIDDNLHKIHNIIRTKKQSRPKFIKERRDSINNNEYWLSILDIDNFKSINDTFGHIYGDEVLVRLTKLMKKAFRPTDLLFRYGGEEFIIIIKVDTQETAQSTFNRFRESVECYDFPQIGKVTISLGATQIYNTYDVASTIIGHADQALYYAKEHGKNNLSVYESLVASGELILPEHDHDMESF